MKNINNPFDVIIQSGISFLRGTLFDVIRCGSRDAADAGVEDKNYLILRIKSQYELLNKMTEEEREICRKNSVLLKSGQHPAINDFLFELESSIPTIWSENVPELGTAVEKAILRDSPEVDRRCRMRELAKMKLVGMEYDECENFFMKCLEAVGAGLVGNDDATEFVRKYGLDDDDINIMLSTIHHIHLDLTKGDAVSLLKKLGSNDTETK